MQRSLILAAVLIALGSLGVTRVADIESRMARLDEFRAVAPERARAVERDLDALRTELGDLRTAIAALDDHPAAARLAARVDAFEAALTDASRRLDAQQDELASLEARQASFVPEQLDARLQELELGVQDRWDGLSQVVTAAASLAERTHEELGALNANLSPDADRRWSAIVGPTVQLAGETTVGSGVLLPSQPDPEGDGWTTLVLTSWHVVRDILADAEEGEPIPVSIYDRDGGHSAEQADLLHHDPRLDAALLRLRRREPVPCGARLAGRERLASMGVFQDVYAVGCPLGNDPIPTRGEVSSVHHEVDGGRYWMISAPTYIGNSGGGIYDEDTHELLGIFSKIYTHGNLRPTVVPHMGLVTPLGQVYDWLEREGHARVVDDEQGGVRLQIPQEL